ncbi:hypothetical protein B0H10DRAFT_1663272, partial [Mycena sp. CBHHK59/15]
IKSRLSIKLLGVHIDRELQWKPQCASALAKGHEWLARFSRLSRTSRGIAARPMRHLYLSICVPQMLYAADVFLSPPV